MAGFVEPFERWFNRLALGLVWLVAASIGLITFLIPLNLLLLKTGLGSMWWLYEAVEYALYVGVFIGAPWVLQQGAHVRVDVLVSALSPGAAARLERALDVLGGVLCLVLFTYGLRAAIAEYRDETLPDKDLRIANWIMMAVFAFSFLMLTAEFGLRFRRAHEIVLSGKPTKAGF